MKLGDISSIYTGPFGSQLHQSDYSEKGTPVVMPKDLVNGTIVEYNIARVSEEHIKRLKRHILHKGDIVYSRRGDVGRCAYVTEKEDGWLCGTGCFKVVIEQQKAVSKYVFFHCQDESIVEWIKNRAVGSTLPNLNTDIISKVPIYLPSLIIQHKIASILSAYDTLIENNRKRIKLLEHMAENLYKEWFVRFRFPGYERAEFEGGIPKGWSVEKLNNCIEVCYGKDHKKIEDGDIPIFGSGGIMRYGNKALFDGESVLIPRKGSLNNVMYYNGKAWTVDTMFYTKMLHTYLAKYMFYTMDSLDLASFNSGAALPSMTTDILYHFKIIKPAEKILKMFDEILCPLYCEKDLLAKQNDLLTRQRDLLLPRLMSGKVSI